LKQAGKNVVVIGGGISGLAAAFWLRQNGFEVTVLERDSRAGGVIRSEHTNGYTLDYAANCLANFLPEVNHLCETVGLSGEQIFRNKQASRRYLLKQGITQAVPLTAFEMMTSSFWPWTARLRMAMEPFVPASEPESEETVADFVRRRFGRELFEQAIEPFIAGTFSGDAEQACVRSMLPRLYGLEQQYGSVIRGVIASRLSGRKSRYPTRLFSFRDGMEALPHALARYLGNRLVLDTEVKSITRSGRRWKVEAEYSGCPVALEADAVILAVPAQAAARLLDPLSDVLAVQLKSVVYAPMAVVFTGFRKNDIRHPLDGIGCLVPGREGRRILGSLWNSSLFVHRAPAGRALLTSYVGGLRRPDAVEYDDQKLLDWVMTDMKAMLGIHGNPEVVRIIRHRHGLPQYQLGHQRRLATIAKQLRLLPGLYLCGNFLDGISIRDRIARGRQLANRICSEMSGHAGLSLVRQDGCREEDANSWMERRKSG